MSAAVEAGSRSGSRTMYLGIQCLKRAMLTCALTIVSVNCHAELTDMVPKPPRLNAKSYVLLDSDSGQLLAGENVDERMEPASLTKIMTVLVAANAIKTGGITLEQKTTVSEKAWKMEGSRMFIEVNKEVSVTDLLDGIIIQSGNDASVALAEFISGGEDVFADEMNQAARRIGMNNSSFANSTGLPDPNTFVTAYDLALLSAALIKRHPEIYQRFGDKEFTYNQIKQQNRNRLLARDSAVDGIKTGHTEAAGYCLVSSARKNGLRLIAVVMGSDSDEIRTEESHKLLNYGFRFFENRKLYSVGDKVADIKVWKGDSDKLNLSVLRDFNVTIPRGLFDEINATAKLPSSITAPVSSGQAIGEMILTLRKVKIATVPLVAADDLAEGSMASRLIDEVMMRFE